jgi:penicillin-binding protein 2
MEAPEIAIAVLVENAGHGGSEAAPVAQRVLQAFFHPAEAESLRAVAERKVAEQAATPAARSGRG